jgi:hypothetical protein
MVHNAVFRDSHYHLVSSKQQQVTILFSPLITGICTDKLAMGYQHHKNGLLINYNRPISDVFFQ